MGQAVLFRGESDITMRGMEMKNPFPYSDNHKRYYTYAYALKQRFGERVARVSLNGGFTCPNIDGNRGIGGCTYCASGS